MPTEPPVTIGGDVLWRVRMFSRRQRIPPGQAYWYDNSDRKYAGDLVLQYTLEGEVVYVDAAGRQISGPGSILMFGYGEKSVYRRENQLPYTSCWINLCGPGLAGQWRALRERFGSVVDIHGDARLLREMEHVADLADPRRRTEALTVAAAVQRLVLVLARVLIERHAAHQTPAQRAVEELLRSPTTPWSLKQVASRFGCSREHLVRVFTERVGQPPSRYLTQARVDAAVRILQHSNLPLKQVARQSGFGTVHTMIRQLKRVTGRTPGQLRAAP